MAVFRKGSVDEVQAKSSYPGPYNLGVGFLSYVPFSSAGGLTQFGAAFETLHPGKQSSQMHWHSHEDEFLYMLDGRLLVIEDGEETEIGPGDACVWRAGVDVAHCLRNHTDAPAHYLIVGTKNPEQDVCSYPGLDLRATPDGFVHLDGTPWDKN